MNSDRRTRVLAVAMSFALIFLTVSPIKTAASINEKPMSAVSGRPFDDLRTKMRKAIRNEDNRDEFSPKELEQMRTVLLELLDRNY